MELIERYRAALKAADAFERKALQSTQAKDAELFMALAAKSQEAAMEMYRALSCDSLGFFLGYEIGTDFGHYLEFCARNGLHPITESDFDSVVIRLQLDGSVGRRTP